MLNITKYIIMPLNNPESNIYYQISIEDIAGSSGL